MATKEVPKHRRRYDLDFSPSSVFSDFKTTSDYDRNDWADSYLLPMGEEDPVGFILSKEPRATLRCKKDMCQLFHLNLEMSTGGKETRVVAYCDKCGREVAYTVTEIKNRMLKKRVVQFG